MIYYPSSYSRFGPQPTKYALTPFESLNCISLVDLLIQEGRDPIVKSLLELAREAQDEAMVESENSEIEHYAYSLAWHYFCLQKCDEIDNLIENLKSALRRAEELKSMQEDLFRKLDCAMGEILDLQKYVVPEKGRPLIRKSPYLPIEELMCGALDPATVADLGKKRLNEVGLDIFLDGVVATLNKAPWGRAESGYEYVVLPGMRLDFLRACQDVLVDMRVIKSLSVRINNIGNVGNELSGARRSVLREWDNVRQGCAVPPMLWNIVRENINSKLSAA